MVALKVLKKIDRAFVDFCCAISHGVVTEHLCCGFHLIGFNYSSDATVVAQFSHLA